MGAVGDDGDNFLEALFKVGTQLEEAILCKQVMLGVWAIGTGHDAAFPHVELAENILFEYFTCGTFGRAGAPIDHVKRAPAQTLRLVHQILRTRPAACDHCVHQFHKDLVRREISRQDPFARRERPEDLADDSF